MIEKLNLEIPYEGSIEKCEKLACENPLDEIWGYFLMFGDISYIKRIWAGQAEEVYEYISTSILQAYEYFKASRLTSLRTRPLLLYYCFLNLTKAVLYVRIEKKPSEYHGLCKANFNGDFYNFSVNINNGVFMELNNLLGATIKEGATFNIFEFCDNAIEAYWPINFFLNRESMILIPNVKIYLSGKIIISFSDSYKKYYKMILENSKLLDDFEIVSESEKMVLKNKNPINENNYIEESRKIIEKHFTFSVFHDNGYYLNIINEDKRIPPALAYYGIFYLLSNLVRYRPDKLYTAIEGHDTSLKWLINKLCDIAERVFPNIMFNILYGKTYKFISHH